MIVSSIDDSPFLFSLSLSFLFATTTCDVSTFPATTAAGYSGASIDLSGIRISIALRHPSFMGISESTSVRKTYMTAARQTALGALKLERDWGLVPGGGRGEGGGEGEKAIEAGKAVQSNQVNDRDHDTDHDLFSIFLLKKGIDRRDFWFFFLSLSMYMCICVYVSFTFKVDHRALPLLVYRDLDLDHLPTVESVLECTRLEAADRTADFCLGVGDDMIHVRRDRGPGVLRDQPEKLLDALFVGGDLSFDVSEVLERKVTRQGRGRA